MKRHSNSQYATRAADITVAYDDLAGRDRRWINRALGVAYTSEHATPMGAVAVCGGSLVGVGVNRRRNHPRVADWLDCSVHAEMSLAERADLTGAVVYVARANADGGPMLAKPCRACLEVLTDAGAKRVVWTDTESVGRINLSGTSAAAAA